MRGVGGVRRGWRRCRSPAALVCACVCAALAARLLASRALTTSAPFPHTPPSHLAHLLADLSAHTLQGPWSLQEEAGNYTWWSYGVTYECGPRCAGAARLEAHERGQGSLTPRHGAAAAHRVLLRRAHCWAPPLWPWGWPTLCEEIETESLVSKLETGGAQLDETWRSYCSGALAVLLPACSAAPLQALADQRLQQLRELLHHAR